MHSPAALLFQVRVAALQNLVKIMSLYYQYMETYMGPALFAVRRHKPLFKPDSQLASSQRRCYSRHFLFQITIEAMKSDIDEVALQGIEFWSNVCDEEMDLAIEASEVSVTLPLTNRKLFCLLPVCSRFALFLSNRRPRSRDAPPSTPVSSTPKVRCSTWSPSSPRPSPSR